MDGPSPGTLASRPRHTTARLNAAAGPHPVREADTSPPGCYVSTVLGAVAIVVPLAVAGTISPAMLTEQALLLAGRDGRRTGTLFAAGAVATLLALVLVVFMVSLGRVRAPD